MNRISDLSPTAKFFLGLLVVIIMAGILGALFGIWGVLLSALMGGWWGWHAGSDVFN
jgi:hypothetical protein